jgi:glucokinase
VSAAIEPRGGPTLGVDLGGTKVLTALVDADGRVLTSHKRPTDARYGPEAVIADVVACVRDCLGDAADRATGLGIGVAGQVDTGTGTVSYAPNLGWQNVALGDALASAVDLPVVVANDVRAAAVGEWQHGSGAGTRDLVALFVGTGIGGAVVADGNLLEGSLSAAGELGHTMLVADGRACHCPNTGCLEAYAAGWAIAERARDAVRIDPFEGAALVALAGSVDDITAEHVTALCRDGDALAFRIVDETGRYLAAGATGLVNAFNPEIVVFGGGVIEALPEMVSVVREHVHRFALPASRNAVRIEHASLGGSAGVVGAAALARNQAPAMSDTLPRFT